MTIKVKAGLQKVLGTSAIPIIAAGIAILLVVGSVDSGVQFSDYTHRRLLLTPDQRFHEHGAIMGLFAFSNGNPALNQLAMEIGKLPWWAYDELKFEFFRPLAAMTHWLDYHLWPDRPAFMHLHSLFWFGAMIFMAAVLYRRLMTPLWVAGLAALLYAIDDAHGIPAGWIANRNALIAAVFGFLSLYCHDRWRRDAWRTGAVLGPGAFLLGLFSAEAGLGAGAYILAYQLFIDTGYWKKRALALAPYAAVVIGWWLIYKGLGFGSEGGGAYIDPGRNPLTFIISLAERIPVLLYGQWLLPDASIYGFLPKPLAYIGLGVIYLLLIGVATALWPVLKHDRVARFWATGMVLALLPVCATFPSNRLLLFVGLGALGLLAQFLAAWFGKADWLPASKIWRGWARGVAAIFVLVHLIAAPLKLPSQSQSMARMSGKLLVEPMLKLSRDEDIAGKTLVFINPPIPFVYSHVSDICQAYGMASPKTTRVLASGLSSGITISRIDAFSLEVEPERGFITQDFDRMYRGASHPMRVGQQVGLRDMRIEVLSLTDDRRPRRVRFTFSQPLQDNALAFYAWKKSGFSPFVFPQAGASTYLPRVSLKP